MIRVCNIYTLKNILIAPMVFLTFLPLISYSQPANDACANAAAIPCGSAASGNTTTATIDGPGDACNGGSIARDIWFTITGTGTNITASLCGSGYDTKLDVYTGSCGVLTNIGGCNDDFCGLQSQMTWSSTLGVVYRIRVHGFNGGFGFYTLGVTCAPVGLFQNMQTSTVYTTLQGAIDAAMPAQTIVLLGNVSESNVNVTNSVIIDANGFTLTIPTGNLTIPTGNAFTWSSSNLIIASGANIVNNGTLKNNGNINYNNATPWINAQLYSGVGTFNGSLTNNGTLAPGN